MNTALLFCCQFNSISVSKDQMYKGENGTQPYASIVDSFLVFI